MDQEDISRLKYSKCCAGVGNPKCKRKGSRSLSATMIEKIRSMGYDHQLDESMRICTSCFTILWYNRSVPQKKRRTDEYEATQEFDDPQPSTSKGRQESTCETSQPPTVDAEQPIANCEAVNNMLGKIILQEILKQ